MTDLEYLTECYRIAGKLSRDPATQNGAVIVNVHGDIVSWGTNRFPPGVIETAERLQRPAKYARMKHAESGAIFRAASKGAKTYGCTMYACWASCANCVIAIIASGIKKVISHDLECHKNSKSWLESITMADEMLKEAGVEMIRIPGKIGLQIKFNEELIDV